MSAPALQPRLETPAGHPAVPGGTPSIVEVSTIGGSPARGGSLSAALFSPKGEIAAACITGALLLVGLAFSIAGLSTVAQVSWWIALSVGMVHGLRAAFESLRERSLDIDVLMAAGAVLAALVGAVWEGALLLFLFVLAGGLEGLATARTTRAVEALHRLMPTAAQALRNGAWIDLPPEQLISGDVVRVAPGETIPADARIDDGRSNIDQASLTGESMPREVAPGDEVYAGTINLGNPIRCTVLRPARESSLQRILDLVTTAQQQRAPLQRLIDRVNQPYAAGVFITSAVVFLVWWLAFGDPWTTALYTAITLLIVASPCAVIIATPTATLAAITRGARAGVLFKGGQSIERLARLGAIAFDKTGTLTVGEMRVAELHPVGWSDQRRLVAVAAGLEQSSTHPIAVAIRAFAEGQQVEPAVVETPGFTAGRGVSGLIAGAPAKLGTYVFVEDLIPECLRAMVRRVLAGVQARGEIATVVAHDGQAGVVILSDRVRPGAERLVADLHALGVAPVVMLTGDNRGTAAAVAATLGIDRFHAELLPPDKVARVDALKQELAGARRSSTGRGPGVGVIGDGVNDAPALASADVSIAIGSIGSDAALESADIVLLADNLAAVPWAVALARRARRTILINLIFALSAIVVMAIATLVISRTGERVPLWLGVLGHEGGTLLVVGHSLLLLIGRGPSSTDCPKKPEQ